MTKRTREDAGGSLSSSTGRAGHRRAVRYRFFARDLVGSTVARESETRTAKRASAEWAHRRHALGGAMRWPCALVADDRFGGRSIRWIRDSISIPARRFFAPACCRFRSLVPIAQASDPTRMSEIAYTNALRFADDVRPRKRDHEHTRNRPSAHWGLQDVRTDPVDALGTSLCRNRSCL